jgi:quercetin dioxygenase-like cupin family protein
MQYNVFQPWAWFIATAMCYFTLPLVLAQAATGAYVSNLDALKGASTLSGARPAALREVPPAELLSRGKTFGLDVPTGTMAAGMASRARMIPLYGDPAKAGPLAVRFQFPAGYQAPIETHRADKYISVISGKMRMALGERGDASGGQPLVAGAFMKLPADGRHRLWADADSVVELHSSGPFDLRLAA